MYLSGKLINSAIYMYMCLHAQMYMCNLSLILCVHLYPCIHVHVSTIDAPVIYMYMVYVNTIQKGSVMHIYMYMYMYMWMHLGRICTYMYLTFVDLHLFMGSISLQNTLVLT